MKIRIPALILTAALWFGPALPAQEVGSMAANEERAVATVRLIVACAMAYRGAFPSKGYPDAMSDLDPSGINCLDAKYGEPVSEGVPRNGYRFYYRPTNTVDPTNSGFEITARPEYYGSIGTRSFFTDESGVIRSTDQDREASASDDPMRRRSEVRVLGVRSSRSQVQEAPSDSSPPPLEARPVRDRAAPPLMGEAEHRAVGLIRLLINCAVTYQVGHPNLGYPTDVRDMGMDGDRCIEEYLNFDGEDIVREGYRFTFRATRPVGPVIHAGFEIIVRPEYPGAYGARSFFADDSGVIRFTVEDREPTVKDKPL